MVLRFHGLVFHLHDSHPSLTLLPSKKKRSGVGFEVKRFTHMRSMTVIKMPPPLPSKKNAAAGGTKPSLASVTVMGKSSAKADRPKQVAKVNGMQNLQQGLG